MGKRGKSEQQAARSARLSAALRENLKRRKAQARSRAATRIADVNGIRRSWPPEPDQRLPTFAAIGVASKPARDVGPEGGAARGDNGSHSHRRRPAAQRHHPDFRRQERHAAADDREPAHRRDARSSTTCRGSPTSALLQRILGNHGVDIMVGGKRAGRDRSSTARRCTSRPRASSTPPRPTSSSPRCARASG